MIGRIVFGLRSPAGPRARLSVLIFHRVLPAPDALRPGEPDAVRFAAQMSWVREWFNVLALDEAVERLRAGSLPARALCVTFDDGYADNLTVALPILQRLGLPATFFVASGYLDGGRMFNDTVIEAVRRAPGPRLDLADLGLGTHPLDGTAERRAAIAALLERLKYRPSDERADLADAIAARVGAALPADLMMSGAGLRALADAGMTIGAHTASHPILARISDGEAQREIETGRAALEARIGRPVTLFAYPNGKPGRDYTAAHVAMVRRLGFAAAVSTAPGAASPGGDPFQLPRFTPWDRTRLRYGLRLAGNLARRPQALPAAGADRAPGLERRLTGAGIR